MKIIAKKQFNTLFPHHQIKTNIYTTTQRRKRAIQPWCLIMKIDTPFCNTYFSSYITVWTTAVHNQQPTHESLWTDRLMDKTFHFIFNLIITSILFLKFGLDLCCSVLLTFVALESTCTFDKEVSSVEVWVAKCVIVVTSTVVHWIVEYPNNFPVSKMICFNNTKLILSILWSYVYCWTVCLRVVRVCNLSHG